MHEQELIPHLFRTEFRKIASVLCRLLGVENIQLAEDIASDTFLLAVETWTYKGIPPNPAAWLYTVARNKAKNAIIRNQLFTQKIAPDIQRQWASAAEIDIDLSEKNISDSQLQMLFAVCHTSISRESQIALALRVLCGFGIDEIADAFLCSKDVVNKRLYRAREKLRAENISIAFPDAAAIGDRLQTVLRTIYLVFSEGYYSESSDEVLRKDFCLEAMRLAYQLTEYPPTNAPAVQALLALMCFHSSRFEARKSRSGELILYDDQDEDLWDQQLIEKGIFYFQQSIKSEAVSTYHLQAGIAYWHTVREDNAEKWESILQLYNRLLQIEYSPVAALNRTYAVYKANGVHAAIVEAERLALTDNHFYYTLLGELYQQIDRSKALGHFRQALLLAKTNADRNTIQKKIESIETIMTSPAINAE